MAETIKIVPKFRVCEMNKLSSKRRNTKKTTEEYKEELKTKNPNIEVLEEYKSVNEKILHRYKECGHERYVTPASALQGSGCLECSSKKQGALKMKSHEDFIKEVSLINQYIKINSKYTGAKNKIDCECIICRHLWSPFARDLLCGKGCPRCAGNIKLTHDEFIDKFNCIGNSTIKIKGVYINSQTPIECECQKCFSIFKVPPYRLLTGSGCKKCADKERGLKQLKTHEQFVDELLAINPYIKITSKYIGANKKIGCKCLICLYEWNPTACSLLNGIGCPICKMSHGEREVIKFLDVKNIKYIHQKTFNGLFGVKGGLLSYDFYLQSYNLLIEFQGQQHEKPHSGIFGGEGQFKIQQEHDKRKREYAKQNNINLLEIWYYDIDNIEEILTNKLNNLKLESVETAMSA